ncbi:MAG TPA: aminotransferase class V-fold PLP-dependent enzyme [Hypericibacter adhaerens]|uniref:Cysteine desulfurase-like protein n=1 Tax=Hypericibacter adhaerens TaxID=2602016 RepID=A0A5J6MX54_9PROT|nr:aminotransferase class V-fold PLP-dependent enzyme [Hypericibacter adhaerens]QEX22099.1 cysteine desulfurase-like protein [Hypericibacter adhaerens]HWA41569.1 aminotransferase class V-fold PLP-dependent enzyme [Hypericibacter adhaerens]
MTRPLLDLDFVRRQFPPLGNGWIMLENAGGSYVPQSVIDRVTAYMREVQIQPSWDFGPSADAAARIAAGRRQMAEMINAEPEEVSIGPSTTLNVFLLMQAIRHWFRPGDEVIVTNQDHEANIGAWRRLADDGVVIREWQIDPVTGELDETALERLLGPRTRLVCFTHCSNIVATIHDVARLARRIHQAGALVMVDGVACAPHRHVDVKALDVDFYAFSLYKVFGPHQGLLYGKREHLLKARGLNHFFIGEDEIPLKLLPGGVNHEFTAGLTGIADYFDALYAHHFKTPENSFLARARRVYELIARHEEALANQTLDFLRERKKVRLIGQARADGRRAPTISFTVEGMSSRRIAEALNARKIAIGYGDFYAKRCIDALGTAPQDGVVRIGLAHYNSADELARALEALDSVIAKG